MRIFIIIVAVIVVIILVLGLLATGAAVMLSRAGRVASPAAAKANGDEMIKNAKVVVAVGAHPDDLEYYTGGTLGTLAAAGKKVIGVTTADLSVIQATRRAEGTQAARVLGYTPIFLGHPERDYKGSKGLSQKDRREIRAEVLAVIRKYHADTVIAYDSADQAPLYHHVDHIRTGVEAQAAAREAGVKQIYLYSTGSPNTQVDTSAAQAKKANAIAAHASQQNRQWIRFFRTVFGWLPVARPGGGVPGGSGVESFRKL